MRRTLRLETRRTGVVCRVCGWYDPIGLLSTYHAKETGLKPALLSRFYGSLVF
jgi:hypothetical protein